MSSSSESAQRSSLERSLRTGVEKKGMVVGEREFCGDGLPEAGAGAGVGSEGADVVEATFAWEADDAVVVAGAGEAAVWVTSGAKETAMVVAGMEVAPRSRILGAMGGVGRRDGRGKRGGEVDGCRAASSAAGG
jgi:hypothetical protein